MEDNREKSGPENGNHDRPGQYELFTKVIKAGKKTYFFDIRKSKIGDHYLVITESMKKSDDDGKTFYNRHKIFVSREDLLNFREGLDSAIQQFDSYEPTPEFAARYDQKRRSDEMTGYRDEISSVDFEDLGGTQKSDY
jgi:hypothetical protein